MRLVRRTAYAKTGTAWKMDNRQQATGIKEFNSAKKIDRWSSARSVTNGARDYRFGSVACVKPSFDADEIGSCCIPDRGPQTKSSNRINATESLFHLYSKLPLPFLALTCDRGAQPCNSGIQGGLVLVPDDSGRCTRSHTYSGALHLPRLSRRRGIRDPLSCTLS